MYDAWGNIPRTVYSNGGASTPAVNNPFKYRGYYYDSDLKMYYLQTRYYDPVMCRFISPDAHVNANGDLVGFNMYAYCSNNPIMYVDPTGNFAVSAVLFIGSIVIGALIGGGAAAYSSIKKGDEWHEVALKTLSGAALGGMLGAAMGTGAAIAAGGTIAGLSVGASFGVGMAITVGGSATLGAANSFVNQIIDNDWNVRNVNLNRIASDALVAGIKGLLSFGVGAWTGGAGLWNIPKGAAPGILNMGTKTFLNTSIGNGLKMSVDAVYAAILEEECGWISGMRTVQEWIF